MEFEKSCGAILFKKDSDGLKFLLVKHVNSGHWDFPKGHPEVGESEEETARREVHEETGLVLDLVDGFREAVSYSYKRGSLKTVVFFLGQPISDEVNHCKKELLDFAWMSFDNAHKTLTYDLARDLLKIARDFLTENAEYND